MPKHAYCRHYPPKHTNNRRFHVLVILRGIKSTHGHYLLVGYSSLMKCIKSSKIGKNDLNEPGTESEVGLKNERGELWPILFNFSCFSFLNV